MDAAQEAIGARRRRLLGQNADVASILFDSRSTFCAPAAEAIPVNLEGAQKTVRLIGNATDLPGGSDFIVPPTAEAAAGLGGGRCGCRDLMYPDAVKPS